MRALFDFCAVVGGLGALVVVSFRLGQLYVMCRKDNE